MFDLMPRSFMNPLFDMDRMTRDFFGDRPMEAFRTDIRDHGDRFTLEAELPGFQKEDITVDVEGDKLTIQAKHQSEINQKDDSYLRRERYYGSYTRSFDISAVDAENIHARYENGVLTLDLPKKTATVPASRRLEIK